MVLLSCSSDKAPNFSIDNGKGEEDGKGLLYFSLKVRTTDTNNFETAIPEYIDGSEFEHAIDYSGNSSNVIIFLDKNYKYQGYAPLEFDRLSAQGTPDTGEAYEVSFIGFLKKDYHEAFILPEYGIMILNSYNIIPSLESLTEMGTPDITDVLALRDISTEHHIAGRSGNYFTMTSAAYLIKEKDEWKHSVVFEIDRDKVFETRDQAVMKPAALAYVERMASKFSLKLSGAIGSKGLNFRPDGGKAQVIVCHYNGKEPNYNNRSWNCTVTGWGINKFEPEEFYFRNIWNHAAAISSYPYSFGSEINLNGEPFFTGWNKASDHRCFWAIDPHYDGGNFPAQYRFAVDNPSLNYFDKNEKVSLAYLSYYDLSTDFSQLNTSEEGVNLYSTENTFPDVHIGGLWQHDIAGSEVVIGAQLHITGVNESKPDYDLYRNRIGIFYPSSTDFATYFINTFNNQLSSHSTMTFRQYDWKDLENNKENEMKTVKIDKSNYKLYYKNELLTPSIMANLMNFTIPATVENGDGKVIPWVEGMYIGRREIDPDTYEEKGEIQRLNISNNDFKSIIYDWIGAFDHFNKGKMVYSVPIRYKASKEKVNVNGYRPQIGDFGVVRNTWYRFDVTKIDNLGTPVDDPSQKIIPYEASLENSILMNIKVLDWHDFSTDVTLPGMNN